MRLRPALVGLLAVALGACADSNVLNPEAASRAPAAPRFFTTGSDVRVSEIHYDNASTDADERIEVSGPAGLDASTWKVVLYNGSNGTTYGERALGAAFPATCGDRGVIVLSYPSNGIQNGAPDGWALVDGSGAVVEFMSYEGTFTATSGPAAGLTSTDIGVSQSGSEPLGSSLQRGPDGTWFETEGANSFGQCNDAGGAEAGPVASVVVTPDSTGVLVGGSATFAAAGFDENGAASQTTFTWTSSDATIASIDPATGEALGVAEGTITITATSENGVEGSARLTVTEPAPPGGGSVFISELHYDNASTDVGEGVEIEAPAGTDLAGWSIALYNGDGGATYSPHSVALAGIITDMCEGRGVVHVPIAGLQNGSPDGLALVSPSGSVTEFISYEGSITATNGPAVGMVSQDIGVAETGSTPVGQSLQKDANGDWSGPLPATFGACNAAPAPASPIVIDELMGDPLHASGGASWGEWFEVHNTGTEPVDLQGWTIASGGSSQPDHQIASSVVVPAGGYVVLGRGADETRNGGVTLDYNYFSGTSTTIWLDDADFLELRDAGGNVADRVQWSSGTLVKGSTRALRDAGSDNGNADGANWGYSTTTFGDGDFGTPGAANGTLSDTPPAIPNTITFSGRQSSDPALPVGFEDQIFATLRDGSGNFISTTFVWSSETPSIASVDEDGVIHALGAGSATFRATASDGTTATYTLPTLVAAASTTAQYDGNTEFGEPEDGNPSDDFIVRRAEYTASWNSLRGTSNWVSYDLEATHFGTEDRCDCFTFDPELPSARYTTADYTGAGSFHGFGIDRGHLARSADRTSAALDNAHTFYFSNVIPQAADQNQGPWAVLENHLGDIARAGDKEVYVIAGVAGDQGTLKGEGKIVIPAYTWKVAVIMPRDQGLEDVHSADDVEVIAVAMPNVAGIRSTPWESFEVTVDSVEALSGYDVLALLPDPIEIAVESGTRAPAAALDGPYTSIEGESVAMSAAASTDPDGDALTFVWDFGDGAAAEGATTTHTYASSGTYPVRVIATDTRTLADTAATAATVLSRADATSNLDAQVAAMVQAGTLSAGVATSLRAKLDAARARFAAGNPTAAVAQLNAFIREVDGLQRGGLLSAESADALRRAGQRIVDTV